MLVPLDRLPADYGKKIAILRGITAPIEYTTVDDICRNAGITRRMFYTQFRSKDEVFPWFLGLCADLSLHEIGRTLTWHEGVSLYLELLDLERSTIVACSTNDQNRTNSFFMSLNPLYTRRIEVLEETLADWRHVALTPQLRLAVRIYAGLVYPLSQGWLTASEDFADRGEYADFWLTCTPRLLLDALELPERAS